MRLNVTLAVATPTHRPSDVRQLTVENVWTGNILIRHEARTMTRADDNYTEAAVVKKKQRSMMMTTTEIVVNIRVDKTFRGDSGEDDNKWNDDDGKN